MDREPLRDPVAANILSSINMLQENLSELERTRNTPLPFAYQAHLRMSLWWVEHTVLRHSSLADMFVQIRLYLLFLPVRHMFPSSSRVSVLPDVVSTL
jgi:hypothetical protein